MSISHRYSTNKLPMKLLSMTILFCCSLSSVLYRSIMNFENGWIEFALSLAFYACVVPVVGFFVQSDLDSLTSKIQGRKKDTRIDMDSSETSKAIDYLYHYALASFIGFVTMVGIGFFLGFLMQYLTVTSLHIFLLVFGVIHLLWIAIVLAINKHLVDLAKDVVSIFSRPRSIIRSNCHKVYSERILLSKIIMLFLMIMSIVFLSRFPVLFIGGVVGKDGWYVSALAMNIVFEGKILFIGGIMGIFEFHATDKAVVAPLILAMGSIFSGANVLVFQFYFCQWAAFIGSLFMFRFLYVFLESLFQDGSNELVFGSALIGTALYFTIPVVLIFSDGTMTGRGLFFFFFPLLLSVSWQWFSKESSTCKYSFQVLSLSFFLIACHRMSGLIIIPFLVVLVMANLISRLKDTQGSFKWQKKGILVISLVLGILTLIVRFWLWVNLNYVAWTEWYEKNYLYRYFPFTDFLESFPPVLIDHVKILVSLSLAMGILLPLFLVELLISPIIVVRMSKKVEGNALTFYVITKLSILTNLFLIYQSSYFYQAIMHILVFHVVVSGYLLLVPIIRRVARTDLNNKKSNGLLSNRKRIVLFFIITLILLQADIAETSRVLKNLESTEEDKQYLSQNLLELSNFFEKNVPDLNNRTVMSASSSISLKLATLLPSIRFLPNHPSLFGPYGYLEDVSYEFLDFGNIFDNVDDLNKLYVYLHRPIPSDESYLEINRKLWLLANGDVTNNNTQTLMEFFDVAMLVIPKVCIGTDLPTLFQSALTSYVPVFESQEFIVVPHPNQWRM